MTAPTSPGSGSAPSTSTSPAGSAARGLSDATVAAWQAALGAEHAAVFGYGVLGPHLSAAQAAVARIDEAAHRARRDATSAAMAAVGLDPAPSAANYPSPAVASAASASRLALQLEDDAAAAWRYLIAVAAAEHSDPGGPGPAAALRATAVTALSDSAVRGVHWRELLTPRRPTEAFPGI
ncbi:MAG: DUF4439 domain-containing protein [bacterium]